MEFHIDTSILSQNSGNKNNSNTLKIEESISNNLDEFISKNKNIDKEQPSLVKETINIEVHKFLIENPKDKSLVLYGKIINNNQTFYDLAVDDFVLIFLKHSKHILNFISNFVKWNNRSSSSEGNKIFNYSVNIENCLIIKYPNQKDEKEAPNNKVIVSMILLTSILQVFVGIFKKYKFNKWDTILILSEQYQSAYLMFIVMYFLGYKSTICNEHFTNFAKEDFIFQNETSDINSTFVFNFNELAENNSYYKFIIDSTNDLMTNKFKILSLLSFDGTYIKLSNNTPNTLQLDPRDLDFIHKNNLSLNFTNLENILTKNFSIGRETNFIYEVLNKIVFDNKNIHNFSKIVFKKLNIKLTEVHKLLKEIKIEELMDESYYTSIWELI